jgi:hypothetical protein
MSRPRWQIHQLLPLLLPLHILHRTPRHTPLRHIPRRILHRTHPLRRNVDLHLQQS